ncbi:uncharacterized protein LOC134622870 [Pelmatolapia mariae]|uniref:uncharacterized protein LOC134620633 n=1 Tax=Pelmatolapia mariae TaxID=158779 RepID=UPI002FE60705
MKVNIFCCLLACTLGSNVTAGLTHEVFKEGTQVTLRCPHSVEGNVTWSRESGGSRADILTADGDGTIKHINDPQKRYDSQADGSLIILRAALSDSGRYVCKNQTAVELTVIPSENKTTTNTTTTPSITTTPPPPTTATSHKASVTPASPTEAPSAFPVQTFLIGTGLLLLSILILITVYFMWRCRSNRRGDDKQLHVYDEIPAAAELHLINGARLRPAHCLMEQPDSPYSVIGATFSDGNKKGSSQPVDNTYFLLEKPKASRSRPDQFSFT